MTVFARESAHRSVTAQCIYACQDNIRDLLCTLLKCRFLWSLDNYVYFLIYNYRYWVLPGQSEWSEIVAQVSIWTNVAYDVCTVYSPCCMWHCAVLVPSVKWLSHMSSTIISRTFSFHPFQWLQHVFGVKFLGQCFSNCHFLNPFWCFHVTIRY